MADLAESSLALGKALVEKSASTATNFGKALVEVSTSTAGDLVRPVLMPIQQLGRRGRQASVSALAKSLPGIVSTALPVVRTTIESMLRDLASGKKNASDLARMPDHTQLQIEIIEEEMQMGELTIVGAWFGDPQSMWEARGADVTAAVRRRVSGNSLLLDGNRNGDNSGYFNWLFGDTCPGAEKKLEVRYRHGSGVEKLAEAWEHPRQQQPTAIDIKASDAGSAVGQAACLCPLLIVHPSEFRLRSRIRIWWELTQGTLNVVFLRHAASSGEEVARSADEVTVGAAVALFGGCQLRCLTDMLLAGVVGRILDTFTPERPFKAPLEVPVSMKVSDGLEEMNDSLASLGGVVKEAERVLVNLANPWSVDSAIPRFILKRAKGLVIITRVSAGAVLYGVGYGTGLILRRHNDGTWSGPVSVSTMSMALGPQFGLRKSDTILCLPSDDSVDTFSKAIDGFGQLKLGGQLAVAAGPVGRDATLDVRGGAGGFTSILSYSHSQGVFGGITMEGETLYGRQADNEEYYYKEGVTAEEILNGRIAPPSDPDAVKLYAILEQLCSATGAEGAAGTADGTNTPDGQGSVVDQAVGAVGAGVTAVGAGVNAAASATTNAFTSAFGTVASVFERPAEIL